MAGLFGAKPVDQDVEIPSNLLQNDSISALSFSPVADFLAVGSWNNEVRCYQINGQGQSEGKASFSHAGPILDVCWSKDGTKIVSGSADKTAKLYDVTTGQANQVAAHDAPVRNVRWIDMNGGVLATSSWDRTVKYWDLRQSNPIAAVQLPERAYTMDCSFPLLVVGTAERHIGLIHLGQDPSKLFKTVQSPLKMQTRAIAAFPDATGYAVSSIEGRVGICYLDEAKTAQNFSFKCHRVTPPHNRNIVDVYSINCLTFNALGTFATAGSDGAIGFWDKDSKTRTKAFEDRGGPISAVSFSHTAQLFAYAVSYDWSKGHQGNKPDHPNKVFIHICKEDEVKKRVKK